MQAAKSRKSIHTSMEVDGGAGLVRPNSAAGHSYSPSSAATLAAFSNELRFSSGVWCILFLCRDGMHASRFPKQPRTTSHLAAKCVKPMGSGKHRQHVPRWSCPAYKGGRTWPQAGRGSEAPDSDGVPRVRGFVVVARSYHSGYLLWQLRA